VVQSGRWYDPPLRLSDGKNGPGLGMTIDTDYLRDAQKVG